MCLSVITIETFVSIVTNTIVDFEHIFIRPFLGTGHRVIRLPTSQQAIINLQKIKFVFTVIKLIKSSKFITLTIYYTIPVCSRIYWYIFLSCIINYISLPFCRTVIINLYVLNFLMKFLLNYRNCVHILGIPHLLITGTTLNNYNIIVDIENFNLKNKFILRKLTEPNIYLTEICLYLPSKIVM